MLAIPSSSTMLNPLENAQAQGDTGPVTLIPPSPGGQPQVMQFSLQGTRPRTQFQHRPLDFRTQFVINPPTTTNGQAWHFANSEQPGSVGQPVLAEQGGLNRQPGLGQPSTSMQTLGSPGQQGSPQSSSALDGFGPSFLQGFFTYCSNCHQDNKAYAKCYECNEYLCATCIEAHERVRVTRTHHIYNFNSLANRLSPTLTGGLNQPNPQPTNQFEPVNGLQQPGPSGFNPPSSRVVGAGRRSPGNSSNMSSNSNANSSNTFSSGSPGNSIENLLSAASRRTSLELSPPNQVRTVALSDSEIMTLGRILTHTSSSFSISPSPPAPHPPVTPSPPSARSSVTPSPPGALLPIGSPPSNQAGSSADTVPSSTNQESTSASGQGDFGDASNDMTLAVPEFDLPPCARHQMPYRFFCNNCMVPVCNACLQQSHTDHPLLHISEGLTRVRQISEELNNEIRQMNLGLRNALDGLQRMCEGIDVKANQVAVDVKSIIKKFIAAFEAREQDVLRRVEQARQIKIRLISYQMENIRLHYSKLARASDLINDPNKFSTDFEIMVANHQAFRELRQAKNLGPNIYPCEDDGFMFVPPNESYLQSVAHMGHLHISSSPLTNAIRLYRQPLLYMNRPLDLTELPLPAAKSRPIYGCPEIIAVKDFGRTPKKVWGKPGPGNGDFCRPWGITMNRFGQIVISDRSNNRIQVFDSEGKYLFHFGSHGKGFGQFDRPASIAVNPNDDIVVTDKDNHRVQVFNRNGEFLLTFGEKGSQIGQFLYPWDVAIDSMGNILISDTRNHRIQLFKWNGIFIAKWGGDGFGSVSRLFDSPRGVTFDPHGNILVTDFNLHKVVMIERLTGRVRIIGREGTERGQFNRPQGICCDDRGWFIVADSRNYRYQVFNERGEFMWMVGKHGKEDPGEFDRPSDMCIDPEGHIHLMDFGNDRIQVF